MASAFTLEETARRLGWYRWVELRLYEAMGAWVDTIPELDVRLAVGGACTPHAWHASVWLERLPAGRDPDALTQPADERVRALLEEVASASGTLERLVGAYRVVVPRLVAAYTAHLHHTSAEVINDWTRISPSRQAATSSASTSPSARAVGPSAAADVWWRWAV